ncbi:Fructosamine-3-kinase [Hahella chejuensis KCTC 2396]|uniref:Fructosamine-3-kinase n=2 Tax=Hahella chejuensis TaxID=158327 RepID=Q2SQ41_HAHCH|nr:Fructosamine-3-kinase [Hahella chejuensis KCTC 2396]
MTMSFTQEVSAWLSENGYGELESSQSVGGGCINQTLEIHTSHKERFFLKYHGSPPVGMFSVEARSLDILREARGVRVPVVIANAEHYLLLEWVEPRERAPDYWARFGEGLAKQHQVVAPEFGFGFATYCGTTLQPNDNYTDGYVFFAQQRLLFQGQLAYDSGKLESGSMWRLEALCRKLPELVPQQPPSLLHGDLWSGNAHQDENGAPVLIDPACYYGWREAELGMTMLFGGFGEAFYAAYEAAYPLEKSWRDRVDIYNLYHLLNHLNLFGGGYSGQVQRILGAYT